MKKVLVTGGAGFIGTHLARKLIDSGFSIRILDILSPQIHGAVPQGIDWLTDDRVEFIRGSVTDRRCVEEVLQGVDYIVHLAAETGTGQSMYEIEKYNFVNILGTSLLLDVIANNNDINVSRIVLASSRSVYGEGAYTCNSGNDRQRIFPTARGAEQLAKGQWNHLCKGCGTELEAVATCEDDLILPASIYAATKYSQEELVRIACSALDVNYSILRLQNVYGEGQSLKNPYTGILSIFSTRFREGNKVSVFEDGHETRDFVHVSDVVGAVIRCLEDGQAADHCLNVGSGVPTSVFEIATKLKVLFRSNSDIVISGEYRLGDIRHNFADISRLEKVISFVPSVSIDVGLKRFADWVNSQPIPEDLLDKANAELRDRNLMS